MLLYDKPLEIIVNNSKITVSKNTNGLWYDVHVNYLDNRKVNPLFGTYSADNLGTRLSSIIRDAANS